LGLGCFVVVSCFAVAGRFAFVGRFAIVVPFTDDGPPAAEAVKNIRRAVTAGRRFLRSIPSSAGDACTKPHHSGSGAFKKFRSVGFHSWESMCPKEPGIHGHQCSQEFAWEKQPWRSCLSFPETGVSQDHKWFKNRR